MENSSLQLIESIRLEDGKIPLLRFHQKRVNRSRFLLFGIKKQLNLSTFLQEQELPSRGLHKLRLVYDKEIQSFSCQAYNIKKIQSLRIVEASELNYRHKYADRSALDLAYTYRNGCDDILISQHQFVTDTYYANIALFDGRKWWTPAHPLLKGTRRAALIHDKVLHPSVIRTPDLKYFKEARLINAMIPLEESPSIAIEHIYGKDEFL